MRKRTNNTVMHSYPGMVAIVTTSYNGEDNVMAAGWHSYISMDPPIYGVAIGRERHTYELVKNAGNFAVNFLPYEKAKFIQQTGVYSGKDTNKFEIGDMTFDRGEKIPAPILHDAYVAYECQTIDVNSYGDHDWFVGDIVTFYKDETKFQANGLPDFEKLAIPLYLGRSQYAKLDKNSKIDSYQI
ncbi:flavin reductase (DIM6/NTAB) family NADH-FMN oxidoreductase RutF [Salirhabdus euzebyi]|uniref:Flavin reductase (DIM6/NTAB) family NADH-FMN oxidoreductase RutF n=1 Tax=Salirhabdus euzebyi TaxID=394506 RepID=A0A841QAI8_9BACI|nr:flavin reductase family protein [Salirhabdus euzebyi]MBB6455416.1 flavin reductase (DIM6/NTAB) family NADH-FMN oxidoreductase RutF [Salirhabdus euzebyi]